MPRELSPSDRMQIVNIGELLAPGACMVCGNGTHQEGYLRLGVYFSYEGEMYLCISCLTEAAETGGMLSVDEAKYIQNIAEINAQKVLDLTNELEAANERLNHFDSLFSVPSISDMSVNVGTNQSIGKTTSIKDDREPVLAKSGKGEGFNQPELFEPSNGIEL